ncbi:GtrA family protein [Alginatibacterium sediminis]|uniref:GtrA family protein n=1 Tax=Alginatibacterium sediminis TaxID=2164068 RepID=A0A420EFQ2_9ALTE|nr:GtrA family protein [Alginatibacterium sediminis]RKF19539.1 GtrA family protein [Alginatibacterium sediminis]
MPSISNKFLKFALVGGCVFVVDYSIFYILVNLSQVPVIPARAIAFVIALLLSWFANRHFTFKDRNHKPALRQLGHFAITSSVSGLLNLGSFSLLSAYIPNTQLGLAFCFAMGVGVGMVGNWLASNLWVYRSVNH